MDANQFVIAALQAHASTKTAAFSAKLVPTLSSDRFLGVKSAVIKAAAKELLAGALPVSAAEFQRATPHPYVELDLVHMHTLNALKDAVAWRAATEEFLPFVDNWMVTDAIDPALLRGRRALGSEGAAAVITAGRDWLSTPSRADLDATGNTYTIRTGVLVLLRALLNGHFAPEQLDWVAVVRHDDYYVHIAVGWYFATAFTKYEPQTRPFLADNGRLQLEAHRLAIRKIIESRRTSLDNLTWARNKRTELRALAGSQS